MAIIFDQVSVFGIFSAAMNSDPKKPEVIEDISELEKAQTSAIEGHEFPKIISFETLARCGEEIWIENEGQIYRLRRTRQGKLILTK